MDRQLDKNMPILVIDSYPTMRKVVRNCLGQLGFKNVSEAEDGESALGMMREGEFKLVITDWFMPNLAGEALLKEMRANDTTKSVPVVVVTPLAQREKLAPKAEALGVKGVLVKPFTRAALEEKLATAFAADGDADRT